MDNLLSFDEFSLNESLKFGITIRNNKGKIVHPSDFKKVQILTNRTQEELSDGQHQYMFIATNTLFKHIHPGNLNEYDSTLPTLNLASVQLCEKWINDGIIKTNTLYNQNKYKGVSLDKKIFHQHLGTKPYLPKTVYSIEDAKYLKYPIIAKPAKGHSGVGITKFDSYKELQSAVKDGEKFDLYCEAINIKDEYRLILLNDKVTCFMYRKPMDEKTKFLQGKSNEMNKQDTESKLNFVYEFMDPNEFYTRISDQDQMQSIIKNLRKNIPLEYLTIDFAIDDKDKIFVIEINTTPGAPCVVLSETYKNIFEDFYKKEIDKETIPYFNEVQRKLIKLTMKNKKYEFSDKFIDKYIK